MLTLEGLLLAIPNFAISANSSVHIAARHYRNQLRRQAYYFRYRSLLIFILIFWRKTIGHLKARKVND